MILDNSSIGDVDYLDAEAVDPRLISSPYKEAHDEKNGVSVVGVGTRAIVS